MTDPQRDPAPETRILEFAEIVAAKCGASGKRFQALGGAKNYTLVMDDCDWEKSIANIVDNFNRWQRYDSAWGDRIIDRYGAPEDNPGLWRAMSSRSYFSRITEPVLMIHGTRDESCPIRWARATERALVAAGKQVRLIEYEGAGHYMYGPWSDSIRQVDRFLRQHLA